MDMYKHNKNANSNGISFQGYIKTSCNKLVEVFGGPDWIGEEKVNYEWFFENTFTDKPLVFTIYDWKNNEREVRRSSLFEFHVGGLDKKYTEEFIEWLKKKLK